MGSYLVQQARPPCDCLSGQVPLHNSCVAPQVESDNNKDSGSPSMDMSPRLSWPVTCIKTAYRKKNKDESSLQETSFWRKQKAQ